jgi:predicted DCC family thiol-disulfide oxidoreductase YuxK
MLVYDGDCGFCSKCARAVEARFAPTDPGSDVAVSVVPWQWLELDRYGLTERETTTAAYWVDEQGHLYRGHLAVAQVLMRGRGAGRVIGMLIARPPLSWLAAGAYWLTARYRHKLPGATPTCKRPP